MGVFVLAEQKDLLGGLFVLMHYENTELYFHSYYCHVYLSFLHNFSLNQFFTSQGVNHPLWVLIPV